MPVPGYEGWGALGEELAGGAGDTTTYDKALSQAYNTESALQRARRARAQAIIDMDRATARQGVNAEALRTVGYSEQVAPLAEALLRSATTPNMRNLGDFQRPGYDVAADIARQAALGDDTLDGAAYNRANAFMKGTSYEPVRVVSGTAMPSGVGLGDDGFTMIPTPESAERIQATQDRTAASVAKSQRAPARTSRAPNPEAVELQNARDAIAGGADPAMVAQRLRERGFPALAKKVYEAK